uniref:No apical meristem-associated C-terminal domain-containing protein n=1 Tax=Oryza barthii TaxID=65489 RepID=A0A0D3HDJ5_9ORYZ
MVMNSAHAIFKKENKDKPFTLKYMWREVKDLPKWCRIVLEIRGPRFHHQKHTLLHLTKTQRRKPLAKARLKGKGIDAAPSPLGNQPSQNMILYHEAMSLKATTMIKSAKEKKYQTYLKLLEKDTSNFSETQHKRHEGVLDQLAKELAGE